MEDVELVLRFFAYRGRCPAKVLGQLHNLTQSKQGVARRRSDSTSRKKIEMLGLASRLQRND